MYVLKAVNVHEALAMAMSLMARDGMERDSRNGKVLMRTSPVATVYLHPQERVVFHPWRDANPFFHFYESLWMLAGRNDVSPLTRYVKRMASFSDDGKTFNAAYGYRWRSAIRIVEDPSALDDFDNPLHTLKSRDQLKTIADNLRQNPNSRQEVLQIWDQEMDLGTQTKDHACNLVATFQVSFGGRLDMVVFCRSNDIIWGAYGANAVHMSYLLEYVALRAGLQMGRYTQISVNWHAYREVFDPMLAKMFEDQQLTKDPYDRDVEPFPLAQLAADMDKWDTDCKHFVRDDGRLPSGLLLGADPFWADVAWPIVHAHDIYKDRGSIGGAIDILQDCKATDWRKACVEWLERRRK